MSHSQKNKLLSFAAASVTLLAVACPAVIEDVNIRGAVPSELDFSFVIWSIDFPATMTAGTTITIPAEVINNGKRAWRADEEAPFYLSYHWKHPGGRFSREMFWGARSPIPTPVGIGEIVTVNIIVNVPVIPKYYDITIDIVRGGGSVRQETFWFEEGGGKTYDLRIEVVSP